MKRSVDKFERRVLPGGKMDLSTPLPEGARVEVLVITEDADAATDLFDAASSSPGFWGNPEDKAD